MTFKKKTVGYIANTPWGEDEEAHFTSRCGKYTTEKYSC